MICLTTMPGCLGARLPANSTILLALSVLALGLAGCGRQYHGEATAALAQPMKTFEQAHPIEIEKAHTTMALSVPGAVNGLNTYQKERVRHFIGQWRNEGVGKIIVAGNNRGALGDVRDILIEHGVPVGAVEVVGYGNNQPGVKLSFARYVAEGPDCGKWTDNLADNSSNDHYANFGCAQQHNMAAMIGNPRDLVVPRDQTDWSDGDRRDFIFRNFRSGVDTNADTKSVEKAGNISDVAKK
jgi:pilus assembly protein CpaD